MKMGHLQNILSFETSIETGNLQSYEVRSTVVAAALVTDIMPPAEWKLLFDFLKTVARE